MPTFLDNNKIGSVGEYIKENTKENAEITIASPILTIYAFEELRKVLEKSGYQFVRKEFGAEDDPYGNGMLVYQQLRLIVSR